MKSYDVIVIGGGHNGLTNATLLGRQGKRVLLLEARAQLGGLAAPNEFHPGYHSPGVHHDTRHVRSNILKSLGIEKYGLKWKNKVQDYTILGKEGESIRVSSNVEQTVSEIIKYSATDAKAYRVYRSFLEKITPFLRGLFNETPPNIVNLDNSTLLNLAKKGLQLKRLGNTTMLEFLKCAPMSVADYMNDQFETEFFKAGLCAPALYAGYFGSWSAGTALNLLIHECTAEGQVAGEGKQLCNALEQAAREAGVEVRTNARVEKIVGEGNRITGVVINGEEIGCKIVSSSISPHATILDMIEPRRVKYNLEQGITHFRARGVSSKIHLALSSPLPIQNFEEGCEYFRTGSSIDEVEKSFDAIKYGKFSDEPMLDIYVPKSQEGKMVSILVHFTPFDLKQGWDESSKQELLDTVIHTMEKYMPGFSGSFIGKEVITPMELAKEYHLPNGNIYHGEYAIDQLITRPIPSCMRYSTPIDGLYLCGSGSHPGGGLTCAPGYLAAKEILKKKD